MQARADGVFGIFWGLALPLFGLSMAELRCFQGGQAGITARRD